MNAILSFILKVADLFGLPSFFCSMLFFLATYFVCGQTIDYANLNKSKHKEGCYEINKIVFTDSASLYYTPDYLLQIIAARPNNISLPNKILSTYHRQCNLNKYCPEIIKSELEKSLTNFNNEYSYFDQDMLESDISSIRSQYSMDGFHLATVNYSFSKENNLNVLRFIIDKGERFTIQDIQYTGLDIGSFPPTILARFNNIKRVSAGDYFSEEAIIKEVDTINSMLLNMAYLDAKVSVPTVIYDTAKSQDSVNINVEMGLRYKVNSVTYIDSTYGGKIFANSSKSKIIRLNPGDYLSRRRIERSMDNLLSTGVFSAVEIHYDTTSGNLDKAGNHLTDVNIITRYRKLRDWDVGLFLNETQYDGLINTGLEFFLLDRNMFGSAQQVKLFSNIALKDLNRFFNDWKNPEFEFNLGMTFSQPLLWQIEDSLANSRVAIGLNSNLTYSLELMSAIIKVSKYDFSVSFPTRLSFSNYFRNVNFGLRLQREKPLNIYSVLGNAFEHAGSSQDSSNIMSSLLYYVSIADYLNGTNFHLLTSNIISIVLVGDDRDNQISPTSGRNTQISIDGLNPILGFGELLSGCAKYIRGQIQHTNFFNLNNTSVLGIKIKAGLTYLMTSDALVPQEQQFFVGGANSVRAWPARRLRYIPSNSIISVEQTISNFSENYIGSQNILEGSVEYRRKLSDLPGISKDYKWLFNDLSVGVFVDFGNAFGWYANESNKLELSDYITKLAVGTGIGIRYDTPIGPIRLDIATPIYDPMYQRSIFRDMLIVFAIGHAF